MADLHSAKLDCGYPATTGISGDAPGALEASSALSKRRLNSKNSTFLFISARFALLLSPSSRPLLSFDLPPRFDPPVLLLAREAPMFNLLDDGEEVKLSIGARIK